MNDWIRDGQFDGEYRRECYQRVLDMIGDVNPDTLYGASVFSDVEARLRTSG